MSQTVNHRPPTEHTCLRFRASQCEISGALMLMLLLSEGKAGEGWELSNKVMLFRTSGSIEQKMFSSFKVLNKKCRFSFM